MSAAEVVGGGTDTGNDRVYWMQHWKDMVVAD